MVQLQTNNSQGFCRQTQKVKSLYILSADSHQFFAHGMIDLETRFPNIDGLVNYTICTEANSDIFLSEFLTKINSGQLYSCARQYSERFGIRLQRCMLQFSNAIDQMNTGRTNCHSSILFILIVYMFSRLVIL